MLEKLTVRNFKSLADVSVEFPRLAVLYGPNAVGKSNLLDAIQALSRIGTQRTLADALSDPVRGYPVEAFTFPAGGLPELLSRNATSFTLESRVTTGKETYQYRIEVRIQPDSGRLTTADEYLALLTAGGEPKGRPAIERLGEETLDIRRRSKGRPRQEPLGLNYAVLSDPRLGGPEYRWMERTREELTEWRTYYLDPRVAMRAAQPPSDVRDIGVHGEHIAPFLYKLKAEHGKHFAAVLRTLRSMVPSIETLDVSLDRRQGTLDLLVRQDGIDYSSRIVSEGTLRVLGLCAIVVNPWGGSLLAFEEPENGVHPRRLELIAQLLLSLALDQGRQVIVTTHSPLFCDAVLKEAHWRTDGSVALFSVRRVGRATDIRRFRPMGPIFDTVDNGEIAQAFASGTEDGLFEALLLRGLADE